MGGYLLESASERTLGPFFFLFCPLFCPLFYPLILSCHIIGKATRAAIMAWNEQAPWTEPAMVEQDLIICKALVCIFSDEFLARNLTFRGGTALQ